MSELEQARDHARRMATAEHIDPKACERDFHRRLADWARSAGETGELPKRCPGCVTDADRRLWAQIADEIDRHLTRHIQETLL